MVKFIDNKTVVISIDEYKDLRRDSLKLMALEQGGVDNWEWFEDSLKSYTQWLKEENLED